MMPRDDAALRAESIDRRDPVLVVEDESIVAYDLADMLEDMGFEDVTVCPSYDRAETLLEERAFAIAIFDMNLNGRLSTPLIHRAVEAGSYVVIASGYENKTVPSGASEVPRIVKPYDHKDIAAALKPVL